MKTIIKTTLALAALAAAVITPASAATIVGVTIEDFSSELMGGGSSNFDRAAIHTLNGVGYEAGVQKTHSTARDGVSWLTDGANNIGFGVPGGDPLPATITYDLEGNYDLSSMTIWNYNEINLTSRGANNVEVLVASSVGGTFTSLGNFTFSEAVGDSITPYGEDHALSAAAANNTRLIRFNITTNHGGDNEFAGLSEVRFDGIAIPEPSAAALLGLAGFGLLLRRRRN